MHEIVNANCDELVIFHTKLSGFSREFLILLDGSVRHCYVAGPRTRPSTNKVHFIRTVVTASRSPEYLFEASTDQTGPSSRHERALVSTHRCTMVRRAE